MDLQYGERIARELARSRRVERVSPRRQAWFFVDVRFESR